MAVGVITSDCWDCEGVGGTNTGVTCHTCQGMGKITRVDDLEYGPFFWLGWNMETAAAMTMVRSIGYHEGFNNGRVVKCICEPCGDLPEEQACQPA